MTNNNDYESYLAIPPGETLLEIIDDRNMTQKDLALRMDLTSKHINKIIKGTASISHDTAIKLETVLGISARFWNNLELEYQETLARIADIPQDQGEYDILKKIPYHCMAKYGWVATTKVLKEQILNLRTYFSVSKLTSIPNVQTALFRKAEGKTAEDYVIAAWLAKAEQEAFKINICPYNKQKLIKIIPKIRALTNIPLKSSLKQLESLCASVGIAFVVIPALPKTYINGATKWISKDCALISMTIRGNYEDIFWFSFFHELGHVLHHRKDTVFINEDNSLSNVWEDEANEFASETLIKLEYYNNFIRNNDYNNKVLIRNFSEEMNIHIGIIIGRMMKNDIISFGDKSFEKLRRKINIQI